MARLVPVAPKRTDQLDGALDLLEEHFRNRPVPRVSGSEELSTLLDQALLRSTAPSKSEPVRIVRQFACTGGTLICRGLAAQPNITLLSEVDPFNIDHLSRQKPSFAPTDLIQLADSRIHPLDLKTKEEMFLASLSALYSALSKRGRRIVLREHSHGWFCREIDWSARKSLTEIVSDDFSVRSIVTVRHPLDSWLSLNQQGWQHFSPFTIDEYARRYGVFLDACAEDEIYRYEDFVEDPGGLMAQICDKLQLALNPSWQSLLTVIRLTGDSGRSSCTIQPRQRRAVSQTVANEAQASKAYRILCERLGYDPDP